MMNPRDSGPGTGFESRISMQRRMGAPTPWGWIAGAIFIIVLLALVFTSTDAIRTAGNDPAATKAPPAIPVSPPLEAPSTTGQAKPRQQ